MLINYRMRYNRPGHLWVRFTGRFTNERHWEHFVRRETEDRGNLVERES